MKKFDSTYLLPMCSLSTGRKFSFSHLFSLREILNTLNKYTYLKSRISHRFDRIKFYRVSTFIFFFFTIRIDQCSSIVIRLRGQYCFHFVFHWRWCVIIVIVVYGNWQTGGFIYDFVQHEILSSLEPLQFSSSLPVYSIFLWTQP